MVYFHLCFVSRFRPKYVKRNFQKMAYDWEESDRYFIALLTNVRFCFFSISSSLTALFQRTDDSMNVCKLFYNYKNTNDIRCFLSDVWDLKSERNLFYVEGTAFDGNNLRLKWLWSPLGFRRVLDMLLNFFSSYHYSLYNLTKLSYSKSKLV